MSKRDRRDNDGRDRDRRDDRRDRDRDWEDDGQQRRSGEGEVQESDSLAALKAILAKVASQLRPLNLSADESIRLVEQLYGNVLEMDSAMAGEADDTRKSSTFAYVQRTTIARENDMVVVRFPTPEELRATRTPASPPASVETAAPVPPEETRGIAPASPATSTEATPQTGAPAQSDTPAPNRAPRSPRPRPAARPARTEEPAAPPAPEPESPEA